MADRQSALPGTGRARAVLRTGEAAVCPGAAVAGRTPQSALICLDLDGTSVETDALHVWFSEDVAQVLNQAARRGVAWCSNSGRRAENQFGLIQACRALETLPAAILSGERYIHDIHRSGAAVIPRQPHHDRAKALSLEVTPRVKTALADHLDALASRFSGAEYFPADEFVGWQLSTADGAPALVEGLREVLRSVPEAQVLRNGAWVIVTHADFGKGRVLSDAAEQLGVSRERILAVGDQPNDLDMLDGRAAGFVGCPSDADVEVKRAVSRAGGWIAEAPACAGTVQLIQRFLEAIY